MGRNSRNRRSAETAASAPQDQAATEASAQAPAAPQEAGSAVLPEGAAPSAGDDPAAVAPPPSENGEGAPAEAPAPSESDDAAAPEAEQSVADACAELGLAIDDAGNVEVEMLTGMSGPTICVTRGDRHTCSAAEAVRLVRSGAAQRRG